MLPKKQEVEMNEMYNEDYFERGLVSGISGYMNYSWMPELTLRMAHFFITDLPIARQEKVLDFGCAKGFLVKALRILGIEAYGVDVSQYAIAQTDTAIRQYCCLTPPKDFLPSFVDVYDWMIAKDVFEHIPEQAIRDLLVQTAGRVRRCFAVIPLAANDISNKYIVPEYDRDVTHVLARTAKWWTALFSETGWEVEGLSYTFNGCKENWTSKWQCGNGFFTCRSNAKNHVR